MRIANLCRSQIHTWHQPIDKRRLPHSTISTQQRYLPLQQFKESVDTFTRLCRYLHTRIADVLVKRNQHLLNVTVVIIQQIQFIEYQYHWYAICLGGSKETVDKRCRRLRIVHRNDEECLVYIRCNDMTLFRQVRRLGFDDLRMI